MNLSVFFGGGGAYTRCECIKGYAFKSAASWASCALLPVITSDSGLLRDTCVRFCRIECLLPHSCSA